MCHDTNHVSNRQDPDFFREISGSEKSLSDAAAAGALTSEARILNILEFFGPLESPLQDLTTVDGTSIWAGDGVHLTSNATRVAAAKLMARRRRDAGAGKQEGEAGIGDSSEDHSPPGGKGRSAGAKAGTAPVVAVRSAAGEPARKHPPARPAALRAGQPRQERRPAGNCEDGKPPGSAQRRGQRWPPRPLGPLVEKH
jgi:hypothetical protein